MAKTPAKTTKAAPKPPVAPSAAAPAAAPATAAETPSGDEAPDGTLSQAGTEQPSGLQDVGQAAVLTEPVPTAPTAPAAPAVQRGNRPDPTKRPYVVGTVPIRHDGEVYGVGFEIELTIAEAERLSGMVVPLPYGKDKE